MKFILISILGGLLLSCSHLSPKKCRPKLIRAAFDIGSGSTKMNVYEYNECEKKLVKEVKTHKKLECSHHKAVGYKEDLKQSGEFSSHIINKGMKALNELMSLAKKCGATEFSGVATSAFRQAKNGDLTIKKLSQTGVPIKKISQIEEGEIGFNGGVSQVVMKPREDVCVWDIGGSSVQITCEDQQGKREVYLGHLASVPFKNEILTLKKSRRNSPNPISKNHYVKSFEVVKKEVAKIPLSLRKKLANSRVLGIGGVHYYAVRKKLESLNIIKKKTSVVNLSQLHEGILLLLGKSDKELGGGKYVNTAVSNLILVEAMMRHLKLKQIEALKVNLTRGLVASPFYWND